MRAILLAGGLGTRLRPMTDITPKCLVPIVDGTQKSDKKKPLLQIWLERLSSAGYGPFLVNTHYLSNQVQSFIENSSFKSDVTLIYEPNLLGTAGTVLSNISFFMGGDGMVIHADNYCSADLREFQKAHNNRPSHCVMTMMTFLTDTPETCGILELDNDGVVIKMHEKISNPPGNCANGAIYIFSSQMLEELKNNFKNARDISTEVIPEFLGRIYTYQATGIFADIGTKETYTELNKLLHQNINFPSDDLT